MCCVLLFVLYRLVLQVNGHWSGTLQNVLTFTNSPVKVMCGVLVSPCGRPFRMEGNLTRYIITLHLHYILYNNIIILSQNSHHYKNWSWTSNLITAIFVSRFCLENERTRCDTLHWCWEPYGVSTSVSRANVYSDERMLDVQVRNLIVSWALFSHGVSLGSWSIEMREQRTNYK